MKKTKLFVGMLIAAGCLSVYAASGKDPVLMKVNGEPVTLSEFEYMYHKTISSRCRVNRLTNMLICFRSIK